MTWVKNKFRTIKSIHPMQAISTGGVGSTNSTGSTSIGDVAIWIDGGPVYVNPFSTIAGTTNSIILSTDVTLPFEFHSTGTLGFMTTSTAPTIQYVFYE
jgi:hypothetical protein